MIVLRRRRTRLHCLVVRESRTESRTEDRKQGAQLGGAAALNVPVNLNNLTMPSGNDYL